MRCSTISACAAALVASVLAPSSSSAQSESELEAIASWVVPDVVTGYETRLAPSLAEAMPGWSVDAWGNVIRVVGSGSPRRIVACALDRPGLSASQITDDGYLRVHRIGRGSRHPLWDQAFEAQQVRILTPGGPVAGVVARSNGHFAQQHRGETAIVGADDLWVDVGAASAADVEALGIGLLDPVVRNLPAWAIAGGAAGPDVGRRAGCAALVSVAESLAGGAATGETHFVLSAQEGFGWVGLSSYVARGGAFDALTILAPGTDAAEAEVRPASAFGRAGEVLERAGLESARWVAPEVRFPGAHMEVIGGPEATRLLHEAALAVGRADGSGIRWVPAPERVSLMPAGSSDAALAAAASTLQQLVELYGVSGHEWAVRRYVLEHLPAWARERAVVDDIGDIWVAAGPDRDTTVFMAHMDEVGYEVASVAEDGTVTLRRQGGAVSSAWEGQTALLHFDPPGAPSTRNADGADTSRRWKDESLRATAPRAPLRGVFLTRDDADRKDPSGDRAWFGMDGVALEAAGVRPGMQVTNLKEGLRLGHNRFTARALDDRAGTTALLMAINAIDPDALPGKVIFAWSVHEEGGLTGAGAMATRFGSTTRRIYSIDTFVSSDTPLESPHFAYAPLGDGPVLRATENSGVSPDGERARVRRAAREAGIPLQMGLTQGGTDGTQFTFWGAPNQGLSWPGRYSHSPGEVLDLRDLVRLGDLIRAVATAGER